MFRPALQVDGLSVTTSLPIEGSAPDTYSKVHFRNAVHSARPLMMNTENLQPILRCGQCNKPFDKASSLKRHGYYCRSRKTGSVSRKRSCIQCAKKKARCDNRPTGCSTCSAAGAACQYPSAKPTAVQPEQRIERYAVSSSEQEPISRSNVDTPYELQQASSDESNKILNDAVDTAVTSDVDFANFDAMVTQCFQCDVDINEIFLPQRKCQGLAQLGRSASPILSASPSTSGRQQITPLYRQPMYSPRRALVRRKATRVGTQRTANLIFHTFKSYPLMLQPHINMFPPFIHSHVLSLPLGGKDSVEPLENCVSLIQMISGSNSNTSSLSKASGKGSPNRRLFWKNVEMECARFVDQVPTMLKWELLAALQALSIYILIRLGEGETKDNNLDGLLLMAVTAIANRLSYENVQQSALDSYSLENLTWTEWILEESTRRLCVFYQIVNMLVEFEPANLCKEQTSLVLSRLPASKQLWEARSEEEWRAVGRREEGVQSAFGMDMTGELIRLNTGIWEGHKYGDSAPINPYTGFSQQQDCYAAGGSGAEWEEWCASMDSFGGLVMLAASLVS